LNSTSKTNKYFNRFTTTNTTSHNWHQPPFPCQDGAGEQDLYHTDTALTIAKEQGIKWNLAAFLQRRKTQKVLIHPYLLNGTHFLGQQICKDRNSIYEANNPTEIHGEKLSR
jgi:hypothetical protein